MKPKSAQPLALSKETLRNLDDGSLRHAEGGTAPTASCSCACSGNGRIASKGCCV
jgi:hypothetical protein